MSYSSLLYFLIFVLLMVLAAGIAIGIRLSRSRSRISQGDLELISGEEEQVVLGSGSPAQFKAELARNLERMLKSSADDHFFIISNGDYFTQYVQGDTPHLLYGEGAGGQYLPAGDENSRDYDNSFRALGFAIPAEDPDGNPTESDNYFKIYDLNEMNTDAIIDEAIHIFQEVYRVPPHSEVAYTLNA